MKILHIDSSITGDDSVSRKLTAAVVARLVSLSPDARVTYRDVAGQPLPQASGPLLAVAAGVATPAPESGLQQELAVVNRALDEVLAADVVVIGAPMYNFSVPSQLKAWLDALAVPGKTFRYDEHGVHGLLGDKRVVIASARGNVYAGGSPFASADHHESYLLSFFGFLGVTRIEVVRAEGVRLSPAHAEAAMAGALAQAGQLEAA
jgi:FMN-dependent NADH-azoreductase